MIKVYYTVNNFERCVLNLAGYTLGDDMTTIYKDDALVFTNSSIREKLIFLRIHETIDGQTTIKGDSVNSVNAVSFAKF